MKRALSAILLAALAVSASFPALAQETDKKAQTEEARGRFGRGVELYRDGDYRGALIEFNRAYQTAPNFRVLFNIGQTCLELQDYACALKAFEKYVADAKTDGPPERRAFAENEVKRLAKLVGHIRVIVDQPGAEVLIDNVSVGKTPLSEPVLVGAGRRTVTVVLPPNPPNVRAVDIAGGDRIDVKMDVSEAPRRETPTPTPGPAPSSQRRETPPPEDGRSTAPIWIGVATTTLLVGGTAVFGGLTLSAKKELDRDATTFPISDADMSDARSKVKRMALVTDILGAAAIVGAGVTTYLILSSGGSSKTGSRAPSLRVGLTVGGAALDGRF